jgi:hypothetical protein
MQRDPAVVKAYLGEEDAEPQARGGSAGVAQGGAAGGMPGTERGG